MRIGLIDVDGTKFPNLVLMKLSAYYKAQGHETGLLTPDDVFHGNDLFKPFDKLMGACVFTRNMPLVNALRMCGAEIAGCGTDDKTTPAKLTLYNELGKVKDYRKKRVYVLTNYWSTFEEDLMRVYWLRDNGYDPYVMIFDKYNASKKLRRLQRWVNNKWLFRACDKFDDYQSA